MSEPAPFALNIDTTVPDETIALRAFVTRIARYLAPVDAEDLAARWAIGDLDTLAESVEAQYGLGREGGDGARFERCKQDLARALDIRSDDWSALIAKVAVARG